MNLLVLAFIACGLLTSVTKAGWGVQRCWKNNVGHCRRKCLYFERYKVLCMNKLNCCTPIKFDEYTPRPVPTLFPAEDFTDEFTLSISSDTPRGTLDDEVTVDSTGYTSVETTTPSTKKTHTPTLTLPVGHIAGRTVGGTAGRTVGGAVGGTAGRTVGGTVGGTAGRTVGGTAGPTAGTTS